MPELERILVISMSSLGDLVNITPVLGALHESRPGSSISAAVPKEYADLFSGHPWVDSIIPYDGKRLHHGPLGFLHLLRIVGAEPWDIAIDLHRKTRSGLILRASKASTKLRYPKRSLIRSLLITMRKSRFFTHWTMAENFLRTLRHLDIPTIYRAPRLFVRPEWTNAARTLLKQLGIDGTTVVALAPGARWETTQWPAERYAELAKRLSLAGSSVVVVGSSDEKELCVQVAAGRSGVFELAGRLTLGELLGLLSQCRAVVGNDSGPTHCAQALNIPTIALFGPTDGRQFVFSPGRLIQRTVRCGPCSTRGTRRCPTGDHACMLGISVDEVYQALTELLPAPKEPDPQPLRW